jgi:hypothetical protein
VAEDARAAVAAQRAALDGSEIDTRLICTGEIGFCQSVVRDADVGGEIDSCQVVVCDADVGGAEVLRCTVGNYTRAGMAAASDKQSCEPDGERVVSHQPGKSTGRADMKTARCPRFGAMGASTVPARCQSRDYFAWVVARP